MDAIADFLLTGPPSRVALTEGLARHLAAEGVPLDRLWLGGISVHPLVAAAGALWTSEAGASAISLPLSERARLRPHADLSAAFGKLLRLYLPDHPRGAVGFPVALWDDGFAEVAYTAYSDGVRPLAFLTFATRSGFTEAHLDRLRGLLPLLGLVLNWLDRAELVEVLARTYLGPQAARRVVDGQIHRGDGERIEAAIWFSDLRGFSAMSEVLPMEELLALLDDAFEAQVSCVERHGGEVLKFMGDGLLAVFRHDDESLACAAALRASAALRAEVAEVNAARRAAGRQELRYGLSLHHGEVMYGNIGAPARLDFTVIGPAVNLAARLEALCGGLDREILVSAAFAAHCPEVFELVGRFTLKGVGEVAALAPRDEAGP